MFMMSVRTCQPSAVSQILIQHAEFPSFLQSCLCVQKVVVYCGVVLLSSAFSPKSKQTSLIRITCTCTSSFYFSATKPRWKKSWFCWIQGVLSRVLESLGSKSLKKGLKLGFESESYSTVVCSQMQIKGFACVVFQYLSEITSYFLKKYITPEEDVSHNVLYYLQLPIAR